MGVCSTKAVWGKSRDARDSRQWRSGCSEKMALLALLALLVGDGVDEGLKKMSVTRPRKAKAETPPPERGRAQTRELENSRTLEL